MREGVLVAKGVFDGVGVLVCVDVEVGPLGVGVFVAVGVLVGVSDGLGVLVLGASGKLARRKLPCPF